MHKFVFKLLLFILAIAGGDSFAASNEFDAAHVVLSESGRSEHIPFPIGGNVAELRQRIVSSGLCSAEALKMLRLFYGRRELQDSDIITYPMMDSGVFLLQSVEKK